MGCTSSTEVVQDPVTGQNHNKHKLGGAYPGNRRTPQPAYTPGASEFNSHGQATAHFINYGGGNALVLQQNGIAQPQVGQPVSPVTNPGKYIQVTLPNGVHGGDKIHVRAPDGRLNEIIVPQGFGPGSTFTVEFADGPTPPTYSDNTAAAAPTVTATAAPANNNYNNPNADDGFATGFNNPNWIPEPIPASPYGGEAEIDLSSYPTATDAKPVYSNTPAYNSTVY